MYNYFFNVELKWYTPFWFSLFSLSFSFWHVLSIRWTSQTPWFDGLCIASTCACSFGKIHIPVAAFPASLALESDKLITSFFPHQTLISILNIVLKVQLIISSIDQKNMCRDSSYYTKSFGCLHWLILHNCMYKLYLLILVGVVGWCFKTCFSLWWRWLYHCAHD